jgi:hypothetical protein
MSTRTLDPAAADKLIKLLGITGSAHAGERDNAVTMANAILRERKLTWRDVIAPPIAPPPHPEPPDDEDADWDDIIDFCWDRSDRLSGKEIDFVHSMRSWGGEPTEKQAKWLRDIFRRLARRR